MGDFDSTGRARPNLDDLEAEVLRLSAARRAAVQFKAARVAQDALEEAQKSQQRDFEASEAATAHRKRYRRAWTGPADGFAAAYATVLHEQRVESMTRSVEGTDQAFLEQRARMLAAWGANS